MKISGREFTNFTYQKKKKLPDFQEKKCIFFCVLSGLQLSKQLQKGWTLHFAFHINKIIISYYLDYKSVDGW